MSYQPKAGDRVRVSKELVVTESRLAGSPETRSITDGNNMYWLDTWDVEKVPDALDPDGRRHVAGGGGPVNCPHGDPTCPCPDGDLCHYEGPDPMRCPRTDVAGCQECRR